MTALQCWSGFLAHILLSRREEEIGDESANDSGDCFVKKRTMHSFFEEGAREGR